MDLLIATLKVSPVMLSRLIAKVDFLLVHPTFADSALIIILIITGAAQSSNWEKNPLPPRVGNGEVHHQMNSPLMLIESFLQALTNADKDGRIVITRKGTFCVTSSYVDTSTYLTQSFKMILCITKS